MKSRFHTLGAGMVAAVVAFGLSACSDTRTADNRQDIDTADRMSPRAHDVRQSTGAASGPVGSADRVGNPNIAAADRQWAPKLVWRSGSQFPRFLCANTDGSVRK